ncbi:hypothetical protein PVAP13_3NG140885 [Panicum virgatum]|uniref:Uncharacterized protein n=1 Tax=Panicum virgatum TaxID=38727 RepID=A0A8T0UDW4_PANVG|nr:hypothetical protein PVAP13_3NG140885 [Panicum virgatum]
MRRRPPRLSLSRPQLVLGPSSSTPSCGRRCVDLEEARPQVKRTDQEQAVLLSLLLGADRVRGVLPRQFKLDFQLRGLPPPTMAWLSRARRRLLPPQCHISSTPSMASSPTSRRPPAPCAIRRWPHSQVQDPSLSCRWSKGCAGASDENGWSSHREER